jgi:glucose-6-phosphate isomerase
MINFKSPDISIAPAEAALATLKSSAAQDTEYLGWLDLPVNYDRGEFARIKSAAQKIQSDSDYLVLVGIGGSYLGARAVIEALGNISKTKVLYAGNSLSETALDKVMARLANHDFSINVVSKSGTTLEPALAFRALKAKLIEKYGEQQAYGRIYATTDAISGDLRKEATMNAYTTFTIPANVGGRYSVLTAVGLLPMAVAGIDIDALMDGAASQMSRPKSALQYAASRYDLYKNGASTEILSAFEPALQYLEEWWKQLFGESEGKDGQGLFPASLIYTTDLHSMGQFIQQGPRNIFETVISIAAHPPLTELENLNQIATEATIKAHKSGGIEVLEISLDNLSAESIGAVIYFFELSCAVSATLLGVDPFNQPGVEVYKANIKSALESLGA